MADIVKRGGEYPGEIDPLRMDPFRIMREMLRMDPFRMWGGSGDRDVWMPHFEVRENGHAIRIIGDVPGVKREELEIQITGNRLMVTGNREMEERHKDENVHAWERQYGEFQRTFVLPDNVDLEHVTSELRDGVLTIVAPMKAGSTSRKITIGGTNQKS